MHSDPLHNDYTYGQMLSIFIGTSSGTKVEHRGKHRFA
jgi:hypothetical protein